MLGISYFRHFAQKLENIRLTLYIVYDNIIHDEMLALFNK